MVLTTFRPPESPKKSGRKSFGGEGRDREVPVHMDQIISSLSSLASRYSDLKTKYLTSRRFALQRFFVVDNALLLSSSFAEWKFMSTATKASRRHSLIVDQLYQERDAHTTLRSDMESAFEKKVNDLEQDVRKSVAVTEEKSKKSMGRLKDEAKANKAECEKLRKENEKLQVRLKQQSGVMESVINQLQVDPERPSRPPEPVPDAGNESYIKYKLHELLSEVDTKYVPPLNYSLLDAPTVNPTRTSAMLGCINVLSPPTSPSVRTLPPTSTGSAFRNAHDL